MELVNNDSKMKILNENLDKQEIYVNINIFRHKFTEAFTDELSIFSKIHQYDHRKDFKEAWNIWTKDNEDLVETEISRLVENGYTGNILDKMFKSARYYFRKKSIEKKIPKNRRVYIGVNKDLLESMDNHILNNINNKKEFKPSDGFIIFCKENMEILQKEVTRLCNFGFSDHIEIKNKMKKTYKNRYFICVKNKI